MRCPRLAGHSACRLCPVCGGDARLWVACPRLGTGSRAQPTRRLVAPRDVATHLMETSTM